MPRSHKDIKRIRLFWDFLNQLADRQEKGGEFDHNLASMFADFLQEQGDARHVLARAATRHFTADDVFGMTNEVHPMEPDGVGAKNLQWARKNPDAGGWNPVSAFLDHAHSDVTLLRHPSNKSPRTFPVLHWQQYIPRTVSTSLKPSSQVSTSWGARPGVRVSRTVNLTAPVTVEQLHQFIDAMPNGATKVLWKSAARSHGWHKPGEEPNPVQDVLGPTPPRNPFSLRRLAREDRNKIGARIKALVASGMDRRKAVKQAVRECRQKLARQTPHARRALPAATRVAMSGSHEQKLDLARKIMHEAGLSPAAVRSAIAVAGRQTRPSAVIAVQNAVSPEHAAYAAAWYGMLSHEPAVTVFFPGAGEHTLHVLDSPHPTDHVVNYLSKAGVPSFAVERRGPGSRAYTVSTDASFDPWQLARGLDARHSRIDGQATRVGGGPDTSPDPGAASRAAYRDHIRSVERAATDPGPSANTGPAAG